MPILRGGGLARPRGMISPMAAPTQPAAASQSPTGGNRYIMRQRIMAIGVPVCHPALATSLPPLERDPRVRADAMSRFSTGVPSSESAPSSI
jgi:hypothetical protein